MPAKESQRAWVKLAAGCVLAIALSACAHRERATSPSVPSPSDGSRVMTAASDKDDPIGQEVLAIVEKMELKAHTEDLPDGSVIVSNTVSFSIVQPRHLDTLLVVHTRDLPHIGTRRVQLGDLVYFVLPHNWRNKDMELSELKNLRFRD